MRKHYLQNAPHGVTGIRLENGEEAIYLDGEYVAGRDLQEHNENVLAIGEKIAEKLGVPFRLLTLPVPDDDEWAWNDITDTLGWGKRITLPRMMLRPVMECCINHITKEDNLILGDLGCWHEESGWLMNTGVGYLIRLDAVTNSLQRLKRLGISRTTRALIIHAIRKADISMIHFSSTGDEVDGAPVFDW